MKRFIAFAALLMALVAVPQFAQAASYSTATTKQSAITNTTVQLTTLATMDECLSFTLKASASNVVTSAVTLAAGVTDVVSTPTIVYVSTSTTPTLDGYALGPGEVYPNPQFPIEKWTERIRFTFDARTLYLATSVTTATPTAEVSAVCISQQ